ncbi:MAG: hypothetical protein RRB13_09445 [bacterium]|nr:hypothetical protein [bacterium]
MKSGLLTFLALCWAPTLWALTLTAQIDSPSLTLGQWQVWGLTAQYGKEAQDLQITGPQVPEAFLKGPQVETHFKDGQWSRQWIWEVMALKPGEVSLPPVALKYRQAGQEQTALSEALSFQVQPAAENSLAPSMGPFQPSFDPKFLLIGLLGFCCLVMPLALWVYRRPQAAAPPISAAQKALARLEALAPLVESGEFKQLHVSLSECLKDYLSAQLGLPAKGQTTEEFLAAPSTRRALNPAEREALDRYFHLADQVKFAAYDPGQGLSRAALENAAQLITSRGA